MIAARPALPRYLALCLALLLAGPAAAGPDADAAAVVQAFNQALTARDQDTAIAQLTAGGVQFTLRSLHDGAVPDKLVAPIADHWKMIVPVIFASTSKYAREVEILTSEAHGDVATVWTKTRTVSVRVNSDESSESEFTEIYLLIATPDGWKIAAIADNRQATSIN